MERQLILRQEEERLLTLLHSQFTDRTRRRWLDISGRLQDVRRELVAIGNAGPAKWCEHCGPNAATCGLCGRGIESLGVPVATVPESKSFRGYLTTPNCVQ